ncbi:MAG TPA: hypothetical protein VFO65_10365, partial [Acidimicrobiales bacterium]|nr:hypothetical protein [Acidimicrobiales bacterium]
MVGVLAAFGLLVTAPFVASRDPLVLLDWAVGGPYSFLREVAGLDGLATGAPWHLAVHLVSGVVGARVTSWLPLAAFFPLSAWAMSRLLAGAGRWGCLAGSLLYAVNPVVVDRAWVGHFGFLVGYALLPLAVRAFLDLAGPRPSPARAALWLLALTGLSPHFAWIGAVALLAAVAPVMRRAWRPLLVTLLALGAGLAF